MGSGKSKTAKISKGKTTRGCGTSTRNFRLYTLPTTLPTPIAQQRRTARQPQLQPCPTQTPTPPQQQRLARQGRPPAKANHERPSRVRVSIRRIRIDAPRQMDTNSLTDQDEVVRTFSVCGFLKIERESNRHLLYLFKQLYPPTRTVENLFFLKTSLPQFTISIAA